MAVSSDAAPATPSVRMLRYGMDAPPPERRVLRAGPLTAVLEGGDLRYITVGDQEVVRRVYVAVRDRDWNTIAPTYTAYEVHQDDLAFVVRFTADHRRGDVHFVWDGTIEGTSAGVITCAMDGEARSTFLKNRIGFCVLQPMDLAGTPATAETPDGSVDGAFPTRIAPHQPFLDMVAISHPTEDGGSVTIRFEGDLFEMEDQRNWTDASYKTYSTPLRLPYPVEVKAGQRIAQKVAMEVRSGIAPPSDGGARFIASSSPAAAPPLHVTVGAEPVGSVPPIGLGLASHRLPLTDLAIRRLRNLQPRHLRVNLDLADDGWEDRLRRGVTEGLALGAALQLEAVAGDAGEGLDRLLAAVVETQSSVQSLLVFPRTGYVSTEPVLRRARELATKANFTAPIGGGARTNFTELNRATLPLDLMDVVGYPITPQVHAFDNASLVENIAAQAATVDSARAIAGDCPLAIGPITLRPRFNPNATGPTTEPDPNELPPAVDPRQLSLFAAGWTVGSIRSLATAGVASLTYFETTGWRGVMERHENLTRRDLFPSQPNQLFPLYHVLADASEFLGADLLPVTIDDPLTVDALAFRNGDRLRVLVASFRDEPRPITLALPPLAGGRLRFLDETTYEQATTDGDAFRTRVDRELGDVSTPIELELKPFAVVRLDGLLKLDPAVRR